VPHGMHGLWVSEAFEGDSYWVLKIAPVANPDRACAVAEVRVWTEPAALGDAPLLEGRACLTEVGGNAVVEISTQTNPVLHLQYLVRLEAAEISVCEWRTVWGLAWDLTQNDASEAGLDGLEYTRREVDEYEQIFLISDGEKLRAYLDANLQRLIDYCDEGDGDWQVLRRVTPALQPAPDATEQASGGEPPEALPEP